MLLSTCVSLSILFSYDSILLSTSVSCSALLPWEQQGRFADYCILLSYCNLVLLVMGWDKSLPTLNWLKNNHFCVTNKRNWK